MSVRLFQNYKDSEVSEDTLCLHLCSRSPGHPLRGTSVPSTETSPPITICRVGCPDYPLYGLYVFPEVPVILPYPPSQSFFSVTRDQFGLKFKRFILAISCFVRIVIDSKVFYSSKFFHSDHNGVLVLCTKII